MFEILKFYKEKKNVEKSWEKHLSFFSKGNIEKRALIKKQNRFVFRKLFQ